MVPVEFFIDHKPVFVTIHLVSAIAGMGVALVSDSVFTFYAKDKVLDARERSSMDKFSKIIWIALIAISLSGAAIFLSDPETYSHSHKFISKMMIVAVLILNGLFLNFVVAPHFKDRGFLKRKSERVIRRLAFASGAVSVVSWLTSFTLGFMSGIPVHFGYFMAAYVFVIVCAAAVAVAIEHRTFERS